MDYLKDHDGANQKEIAAACHIEAGSLTSVLNRMEDREHGGTPNIKWKPQIISCVSHKKTDAGCSRSLSRNFMK
ncbi:MAG: MarR family transcriptional regulator [Mediterraneibacter faecis]